MASFVGEICLKGVLEKIGSIVIVLRLWRFVKIVKEFSADAQERMDTFTEQIEQLKMENTEVKKELNAVKAKYSNGGM